AGRPAAVEPGWRPIHTAEAIVPELVGPACLTVFVANSYIALITALCFRKGGEAQMVRAAESSSGGRGFEALPRYQIKALKIKDNIESGRPRSGHVYVAYVVKFSPLISMVANERQLQAT